MTVPTFRPQPRAIHRTARRRGWPMRPLAVALAVMGGSAAAQPPLPDGFNPIMGGVTSSVSGNAMSLTQAEQRAIVQWNTFSIAAGHRVDISQPGASAIMLNRVTGGELSEIAGTLTANGRVFLVNPAGVLFGSGSQVSTGGLVATTLNITDDDFKAGRFVFERDDANLNSIVNQGRLTSAGGTIALMAAVVDNQNLIQADGGVVGLVSARKVTLDFEGDGLTTFRLDPDAKASSASITQGAAALAQADGGRVAVIADSSQVAQQVVNLAGTVRARSLSVHNGEVVLGAAGNEIDVTGKIDATSGEAGATGGSVTATAGTVLLQEGAVIDASGEAGGGTVTLRATASPDELPEGGVSGVGVEAGAAIHADATVRGNGGQIVLDGGSAPAGSYNDVVDRGLLYLGGALSANAAGQGDGGLVALSASQLRVAGADVSAAGAGGGANGLWRIASELAVEVGDAQLPSNPETHYVDSGTVSVVQDDAIGAALSRNTDVNLFSTSTAADDYGLSGGVIFMDGSSVLKDGGGAATLTVDSSRHIMMANGSRIESTAGALNVDFDTDMRGDTMGRSDVAEYGGAIVLDGATIASNGGNIRFYGQGDPDKGSATGGVAVWDLDESHSVYEYYEGIQIRGSTVSACDAGCAGGGAIMMRGSGTSRLDFFDGSTLSWSGSVGIDLRSSTLSAGTGGLTLEGQGGLGVAGVAVGLDYAADVPTLPALSSAGDIRIVGTSTDATGYDTNYLINSDILPGVWIAATDVRAAGDVLIQGTGSDLSAMTASEAFRDQSSSGIPAIDGVDLVASRIEAGPNRTLTITGTAGSAGLVMGEGEWEEEGSRGVGIAGISGADFLSDAFAGGYIYLPPSVTLDGPTRLAAEGGVIHIDAGDGDIVLGGSAGGLLFDVGATGRDGGRIVMNAHNIGVWGGVELAADGASGGSILLSGTSVAVFDQDVYAHADATADGGNGGRITLAGDDTLFGYGRASARGNGNGSGGQIELFGAAFDVSGFRADASTGAGGMAGTWVIDPHNIDVVHGDASGSYAGGFYDAGFYTLSDARIQDGDINAALDSGTNVILYTGTGGADDDGQITIQSGVSILRSAGTSPLELSFNAHTSIEARSFSIDSTAGALNVYFNSNADGTQPLDGGVLLQNAIITTNGGELMLYGQSDRAAGMASSQKLSPIYLDNVVIDTRVGQDDMRAGGSVTMRGAGISTVGIQATDTVIQSSTGKVTLFGTAGDVTGTYGGGVRLSGTVDSTPSTRIETTSGDIAVTGLSQSTSSGGDDGVAINGSILRSVDGTIDVRGRAQDTEGSAGVVMEDASLVVETGRVFVTGQSASGAGIDLQGGTAGLGYAIDGGEQALVLRADNGGGTNAIVIGEGVRSNTVINLRPGGVDDDGNVVEHPNTEIWLGAAGAGFSLSGADMANLVSAGVVVGSDIQSGLIRVLGPVEMETPLTLQAEGGGGAIAIGGNINTSRLGLLADLDVNQISGSILASNLLARSASGNVTLTSVTNGAEVVAGGAAGDFRYAGSGNLSIGSTQAAGYAAVADAEQARSGIGIGARRVVAQTVSGDLTVAQTVTGQTGATLQAGGGALILQQGVQAATVALLADRDVSQLDGAAVAAGNLLARSVSGDVVLLDAANAVGTLAGGAGGAFQYADADGLTLGMITADGHSATGALQLVMAGGVAAPSTQILARAGDLIVAALTSGTNELGLQAQGGNLNLNASLQGGSVALLAQGDIVQSVPGGITAASLLALSDTGSVALTSLNNQVGTLAGSAVGDFRYAGIGDLSVDTVSAELLDLSLAPSVSFATLSADGVQADRVIVQTVNGNLSVDQDVTGQTGVTLQADAGSLTLSRNVQAANVALLAAGDVSQGIEAGITADNLLARSTGANVTLTGMNNAAGTLAGDAAGAFQYIDADALTIGAVTADSQSATGALQTASGTGVAGDATQVVARSGDLGVEAAASGTTSLGLQAEAGDLDIGAAVQAGTVALLAGGNVTQSGGGIAATSLLARAGSGDVTLAADGNDVGTIAGTAQGDFHYAGAGDLSIGAVSAEVFDASGSPRGTVSDTANGVQAGGVTVQASSGNLSVDQAVTGQSGVTLQADAGALMLSRGVQADSVTLQADGDIAQGGSEGITASSLAADSAIGSVALSSTANQVDTLNGSAQGDFRYDGTGPLSIGAAAAPASALASIVALAASGPAGVAAGGTVIVHTVSGPIDVVSASSAGGGMTLQADAGAITLAAPLQADGIALLASGDVVQSAGTLTANRLLLRSTAGSVDVQQDGNVVGTVAGQAAGSLAYVNSDALTIGTVAADSAGSAGAVVPVTVAGASSAATLMRTLAGDLTLDGPIGGQTADLVAAALFQNPNGAPIDTAGAWRVWADTWRGENRGGLAGSGPMPNLYNRSYGSASVSDGDDHFIYREQPVVTITLDSASRAAGLPNPALGYTVSGLPEGDSGAGISGVVGTDATATSPAGRYAVVATTPFVSAEGYAINVVPGVLTVGSYTIPTVDIQRELPTTYTYDRNIAPVAMCYATGPLEGDRIDQVGDVLSREWSRVRTRPNLTNCVSTDRTNACSNF
ncbi:hypothetical protein GCM10023144_43910 [Pigmentiphaga soli]|uniref:Filamentous haemagglutinin FhaB/tRNA nuclease CdiA-like TPS domain-containing protein n=1 Tax=Pigmentiphaga soli TaxID=1007095 RepID=A0ABP8HPF4_9BURK